MKPLIYFSYGMTKSGSTLAFELVRCLLEANGYPQGRIEAPGLLDRKKINTCQHLDEDLAEGLWQAVRQLGHPVAIKTHTRPDPAVRVLLQDGRALGSACYRDPRDLALSMLDHGRRARARGEQPFSEFFAIDDALNGIRNQTETLRQWLTLPGVLPLAYNDVAFDSARTVDRLARQLGLGGDGAVIAEIARTQRFTQFNKGKKDRHASEMATGDSMRIAREFAPLIETLIQNRDKFSDTDLPVLRKDELLIAAQEEDHA